MLEHGKTEMAAVNAGAAAQVIEMVNDAILNAEGHSSDRAS